MSEEEREQSEGVVQRVEGIWGGRYLMVPSSRIPIFIIADLLEEGGEALIREDYEHLEEWQLQPTFRFIREHPEEVAAERQRYQAESERTLEEFRRFGTPLLDAKGERIGYSMSAEGLAQALAAREEKEGAGEEATSPAL